MLTFDKIVKKMLKKSWKLFFKNDIFEIIDPDKQDKYKNHLDKTIYRLKSDFVFKILSLYYTIIRW